MDSTTSLQQQSSANTTGNPQTIGSTGLQQQESTTLQNTNSSTVNALNNLDQGSSSIPLAAVSQTTTATTTTVAAQPVQSFRVTKNDWLYGGLVIVVIVFMISLYYGLMRQK